MNSLSRVQLFTTPWTAAYQALPSMGFSRQEFWSGCQCLLQRGPYTGPSAPVQSRWPLPGVGRQGPQGVGGSWLINPGASRAARPPPG